MSKVTGLYQDKSVHFNFILLFINCSLLFLSALAVIKSIFVGFDIDEAYAIAQSYRLVSGDRLFLQMWEPHQLSAFGSALFMLPFLLITGGNTTGIVIYLRIVGTVIHLLIGLWFYRTARTRFGTTGSLLMFLIHTNFLPKWISLPEFEIMQYWSSCVLFLGLLSWHHAISVQQKTGRKFLILSGTALFVSVLCYPTMLLLYPLYLAAIVLLAYPSDPNNSFKNILKHCFWFTFPAAVAGIGLLCHLFSYMSLKELIHNASYILADESHSVSLRIRVIQYLGEIRDFVFESLLFLPFALLAALAAHKHSKQSSLVLYLMLFWIGLLCGKQILFSFLGDANQFYLYFRFLLITCTGIAAFFLADSDLRAANRPYLLLGILPGIMGVVASAAITNMTLEIALARIYIAVIASFFLIASLLLQKHEQDTLLKVVSYGIAVLFLLGLLVCKLLLVRVTGCIPISIKMHMAPVTSGPAAGLLVKDDLAAVYNANFPLIQASAEEDDALLYFGCENLYYLASKAQIATPSTQGTSAFNHLYLQYFEEHPEKKPSMVIVDKTFQSNPHYYYSLDNQIVLDWITEKYQDADMTESEYLIIYKVKE